MGINQIYDVDIDRINKPFLPLASGELSVRAAWVLCVAMAVVGTGLAWAAFGPVLTGVYAFGSRRTLPLAVTTQI